MEVIQGLDSLPEPPVELGRRGAELWQAVLTEHELRTDELRVLEDACREVDLIERMHAELQTAPLVVKGSMGQDVANPLVQELRQHRALVARLLGALKLSDEDGEDRDAQFRTDRARKAALTRWRGSA
ncbi:hypothetical protein ACH4UY_33390 [Streptomyces longwoodensis]|uniref:hypothetical protein n=1 Tax=Streptomyces longwoodensis TaxID=68231 RepID=UPI0037B11F2C